MIPVDSPLALGQALRAARRALGLTQTELALAAGVGLRFMVELEAGKPTLRLAQVLRVIAALGGELTLAGLPAPRAVADGAVGQPEGSHCAAAPGREARAHDA